MYNDIELFEIKQFEADLNAQEASKLKIFRQVLERGDNILKTRFETHKDAVHYVTQRAWLADQILCKAWEIHYTCTDIPTALIAVGGYGRGELHPYSDIDLLILFASPLNDEVKTCIENFIMFLWDIRLEIGHSVRTLEECQHQVSEEVTVMTNLMESRLLTGSNSIFEEMQASISPKQVWSNKAFFNAKLEEQTQRHAKYDDTAYNLEPNIKESPGGLRDIQMIGWVAKRHFGVQTLYDLVQDGFLTEKEYKTLIAGQELLWKIRCLLHFVAKRHEDRLLFDYQRILADKLGYKDDNTGVLGVEKFMTQYYCTVKKISTLNSMLLQLFQEAILYAETPTKIYSLNRRFQVRNQFIEVVNNEIFLHYPFALLEIFLLIEQHPRIKGIRATTVRLILQYNYLIDEIFRQDLRSKSLFIELFRQPQGLTHILRYMSNYGVLAAYIPEFGKISGRMQYDLFHVYTVDQHSLFVVRNLRRLMVPEFSREYSFCSELIQSIPKPDLLYLAGLFHDIAKGRGGDHAKLGESDTVNFCLAHGLSNNDTRFVGWLVKHHLLMSTTTQRQDISEPEVIKNFTMIIRDTMHLDYLYLLTVADVRATNPKLWNSWKDSMLTDLYHKAYAALNHNTEEVLDKQVHIQKIQKEAYHLLQNVNNEQVNKLWQKLGEEYFLSSSPKNIARETQFLLSDKASHQLPLVLERLYTKGSTEFIIIADDNNSLFADITYFLEQQNLTIVDAYISTTQSCYSISSYSVLENDGEQIQQKERIEEILHQLKDTITHTDTVFNPITRHISRQLKHFDIPPDIKFSQDPANNHTIMEVVISDRPGVLSHIAQAFLKCKVHLKKAKVATLGSRVEDIFFIMDYENHAIYAAGQLDCLRQQLSELLENN